MIVWAIGAYPVDREDSKVEIVSFVSNNPAERDPETEAVFESDSFYSIGRKIVPVYYGDIKRPKMTISVSTGVVISNSAINANKYPMKELPWVIDDESAIFDVSVCDYVGKEIKFVVKIVFQHAISHFAHLKNTIRPHNSLVFVVGQLEVIVNEFYIYAKDINFVSSSLDDNFSKKCMKIEDVDKVNDVSVDNEKINFNLVEGNKDYDKMVKKDKRSNSSRGRKSGKGGVSRSLRSSSKVHNINRNIEEE
ncbi:hypothetical protein C2G38_2169049 [Gigaspora rosea]|uniref:Uncharacterized protein n=1 Tax=Gigaspora rosea TaxID=44941 RepID=A0A397VR54_9GLOM|nr:hypothetical protein C2G38_2169049 [Gigaspora rosea]